MCILSTGPLLIHQCVATPPSTVVGVADLPFEVLEGIFVYLPVYSLGLCRLVCRFWNSVISNPKVHVQQHIIVDIHVCTKYTVAMHVRVYTHIVA